MVVVTGANDGIGLHLTSALLKGGHRVAGLDLSTENLTHLEAAHPGRLLPLTADVADDEQPREAVRATLARWGQIDVLVNNACVVGVGPFLDRGIGDLRREIDVNVVGYARMIAAVLPHMMSRGHGVIHNLSSVVGLTGLPRMTGYAACKAAVEALTKSLAFELRGTDVHVTLVHLPFTNTRSAHQLNLSPRLMADPARVGRRLAERILSTRRYVTPDLPTAAWLAGRPTVPEPGGEDHGARERAVAGGQGHEGPPVPAWPGLRPR